MPVLTQIIIVLLLIVLNGLFSMTEMALVSAKRVRLQVLERKGIAGAALARSLADEPQRFLPTVQVGITLVGILAGVFGGARLAEFLRPEIAAVPVLAPFAGGLSLAVVVIVITYLTLVLGELVPKQVALRAPELLAARLARPIAGLAVVAGPIVWVLGRSSNLVLRLFGAHGAARQAVTEEELRAMLEEGEQEGVLETGERTMIERLLRLADKPVRAIMTPRNELAWIDRTDPRRDIVQSMRETRHSRLVVCDRTVDNPVGIVQAKDVLDRLLDGGELSIAAALRQPAVMPDTVTALEALERLRSDPLGLALVVDEYGSFEGVVTAADVLEAIVGEAREHGAAAAADPAESGVLAMDGMMPVDEVKARLALPDLPAEGSYHTVAGLVLALLQRVPQVGDRIVFGGWLFEVLEMEGRRVARVRASRETLAEA